MSSELSTKVRSIMEREMQTLGASILSKQCRHLNIVEDDIRPEDLPALASRLSEIMKTCGGFNKAKRVYKDINNLQDLDELVEQEESEQVKVEILENLARASLYAGEWEKSSKYLDQLLSRVGDDKGARSRYVRWMGFMYKERSEFEVALTFFEKALADAKEADDGHQVSKCHYRIGDVYWYKGAFRKSLEHYELAVSLGTEDSDIGAAHIGIANVYQSRHELAKAMTHLAEALSKLKKTDNYQDLARAYNNLGDVYLQLGDWDNAIENFDKGEEQGELGGWLYVQAFTQLNSAEANVQKGEYERALELLEKSMVILEQVENKPGLAGAYHVYGMLYRFTKDREKMVEYYQRSIRLYEEINVPHYEARYSYEFGQGLLEFGDKDAARKTFEKALEIFEQLGLKSMTKRVQREMTSM